MLSVERVRGLALQTKHYAKQIITLGFTWEETKELSSGRVWDEKITRTVSTCADVCRVTRESMALGGQFVAFIAITGGVALGSVHLLINAVL